MMTMLKLSVRSCFRIWIRTNRDREDTPPRRKMHKWQREKTGFNADRWRRYYGKTEIGKGIKEIFSNP